MAALPSADPRTADGLGQAERKSRLRLARTLRRYRDIVRDEIRGAVKPSAPVMAKACRAAAVSAFSATMRLASAWAARPPVASLAILRATT